MYAAQPGTKVIWWSLCTHPEAIESDAANYSAALKVLANIEKRIPGVTVYASALNSYVAPHVCSLTGANGPSRMQALAERLASEGRLRLGPNVGSLRSWERDGDPNNSAGATAANDQTVDDGCHPNRIGEALLGNSLIKFFGK
jgi:hypothetical protein